MTNETRETEQTRRGHSIIKLAPRFLNIPSPYLKKKKDYGKLKVQENTYFIH